MSRFGSVLAPLALASLVLFPAPASAQTVAGENSATAEPPSLAFPRSILDHRPDAWAPRERGIEDASPGVWIGGVTGIVAGGLIGSWAYCGLGEGECTFSLTAAGPGMLIGGILGASIGGLLDRGDGTDTDREGVYDEQAAAVYREELRSYREQLEAPGDESLRLADEMVESEVFLAAIGSLSAGVIVVDRERIVMAWNPVSVEMWGLSAEETVDVPLEDLDFGLPVEEIDDEIRASVRGERDRVERDVMAVNRRGETIRVRVRIVPFVHDDGRRQGAVILVEERSG